METDTETETGIDGQTHKASKPARQLVHQPASRERQASREANLDSELVGGPAFPISRTIHGFDGDPESVEVVAFSQPQIAGTEADGVVAARLVLQGPVLAGEGHEQTLAVELCQLALQPAFACARGAQS